MKKRMVKALLAVVGVCMIAGCNKKADDKSVQAVVDGTVAVVDATVAATEAPAKEMTAEDIVKAMQEQNMKYVVAMDDAMADDVLSKDELLGFMDMIPEGVMTVNFDVDGAVVMSQDGSNINMSGSASGKVDVSFDTSDREVGADVEVAVKYDAAMLGASGEQKINYSFYIVNEDGTYYLYKQLGTGVAERQMLGNLDDAMAEDIDLTEMKEALGGKTYAEIAQNGMTDDMVKGYVLADKTVEFNGAECYHLTYKMTGNQLIEILKKTSGEMVVEDGMTMEDMLKEELVPGMTLEDLYKDINVSYNLYVTKDDLKTVYTDCDMKDMMNTLIGKVVDIALAEVMGSAESEAPQMNVSVDFKKCYFDYSYDEKDVDVKFEGEFEDYEPEFDFSDFEGFNEDTFIPAEGVEIVPAN